MSVSTGGRVVLLAFLAWGCGDNTGASPTAQAGENSSGGAGQASGGASASAGGSGGEPTTEQCEIVDGQPAYGPIGEPYPMPAWTIPGEVCEVCRGAEDIFAIRTATGYDFVWRSGFDYDVPSPNLYSLSLDSNFEGGETRALLAANSVYKLDVAVAQDGYVAATCSQKSGPDWIQLKSDLEVASEPHFALPNMPVEYCAPPIVWTGEGYLTAFADSRGLVVALLDEAGVIVSEEILSEQSTEVGTLRLSQNGDRVLVVFTEPPLDLFRYGVVDLKGAPLGEVRLLNEENAIPLDFAIATNGDGWVVMGGYASQDTTGVRMTGISRDGLTRIEQQVLPLGYVYRLSITPSVYGGTRFTAGWDEGGQFGHSYMIVALIDDAGELVYFEEHDTGDAEPLPSAVIHDPQRDLVIKTLKSEDAEDKFFVQEYGCLVNHR